MILPIDDRSCAPMGATLEPGTLMLEREPGQAAETIMPTPRDAGKLPFDHHDDQWLSARVAPDASIRLRKD